MASFRRTVGKRGPGTITHFPEAASQSFKYGDLVTLSSGKVAVLIAPVTGAYVVGTGDVDSAGDGAIVGMALRAASGTTDTSIPVWVFNEQSEILLTVMHATPASAITAVAQVGVKYDIVNQILASGGPQTWVYTIDDTTNPNVIVQEIDPSYPVGEQYGTAWCRVLRSSLWSAGGIS